MAVPSAAYAMTIRVAISPDPLSIGRVTTVIGEQGALVTGVDQVEQGEEIAAWDLGFLASDPDHAQEVCQAVSGLETATVHRVTDRTFALHRGGKLEVNPTVQLRTREDLSMAYTPGVARVCQALAEHPEEARNLTIKRNTIAIVTDGSAVLGLGNIGATASMPVMEGKAVLFKEFANVDAWPIALDTQDTDEIVQACEWLAPAYGGINLEDIAAPRCFEIEDRLTQSLDIPVFHDDQHGTAIVTLAALTNALRVVDKSIGDCRVVLSGAGAAGVAITKILQAEGVGSVVVCDSKGVVHSGREDLNDSKTWLAQNTNPDGVTGSLHDALKDADVFVGVSAPNLLEPSDIATMADRAIVFAMSNPDPEVDPDGAREYAAVVATGRSDQPNQINNVLAFPGIFRGALDAHALTITQEMNRAAARAISAVVTDDELGPHYIVPSIFHPDVSNRVAEAVQAAAEQGTVPEEGVEDVLEG